MKAAKIKPASDAKPKSAPKSAMAKAKAPPTAPKAAASPRKALAFDEMTAFAGNGLPINLMAYRKNSCERGFEVDVDASNDYYISVGGY